MVYDPAIPLLRIYPKEVKARTHKKARMRLAIENVFIKAPKYKQPKCPSMSKWVSKLWYIPTMEYFEVLKRNEQWLYAITCKFQHNCTYWKKSNKEYILYDFIYFSSRKWEIIYSEKKCFSVCLKELQEMEIAKTLEESFECDGFVDIVVVL